MPFWNENIIRSADLRSNCNRKQGLSYTITGVSPARTATFSWQTTHTTANSTIGYVDVDLLLFENRPDETTIRVNDISSDMGDSATLGSQSQQANKYSVISTNGANISPRTRFEFQKATNYWYEYSF